MVRDYQEGDLDTIKHLHAEQCLDYALYDLDSPLCLVKKVQVVGGQVVGCMFLRLTAETILIVSGSPVEKMAAMEMLQPEVLSEAYRKGLDEVHCTVPPSILTRFVKRLKQLGWSQDRPGWQLFSRSTKEEDALSPGSGR
jgi:hypothetical protein